MMNKKNYNLKTIGSCLVALICGLSANAQHVALEWAKQFNSDKELSSGAGITTDAAGNVYVTGAFGGTVDFDPGPNVYPLTASGTVDVFVTKLDAAGNLIWAKKMGGPIQSHRGRAIAVDKKGNVYTTGIFHGTANFDPSNGNNGYLTANGNAWADVFISKLDASGNFVWAKSVGGAGADDVVSIVVDEEENVFIHGSFDEKADFDPGPNNYYLDPTTISHFVLKLNASGNFEWAKMIGGDAMMFTTAMTIAPSGNIYLASGFFMGGDIDFDPGPGKFSLTATGVIDFCVVRLDNNGTFIWAKQIAGADFSSIAFVAGIAIDSKENVIATGGYIGAFDFDPGVPNYTVSAGGSEDIFVSKLDSAGNFIWAKSTEGMSGSEAESYSVTTDKMDNIYATGFFRKSIDFDPSSASAILTCLGTSTTPNDVFLYKLYSDGTYAWAKQLGGSDVSMGKSVSVDASGSVYSTGEFNDTCNFDPGPGTYNLVGNSQNPAIFIHKMICTDTNSSILEATGECDGYLFGDTTYTKDGIYTRSIPNRAGCDSTITLKLTISQLDPIIAVDSFVLHTTTKYTTYQWLFNDEVIDGATDSTYLVRENGNYKVIVTNEKGCTDTSEVYIVTNSGINDRSDVAHYIKIYPNPSKDVIFIHAPGKVNLILSDIAGKRLQQGYATNRISVKDYAPGVYLLQVIDSEGHLIKTEKIIKE